jgi:hypothetical protein
MTTVDPGTQDESVTPQDPSTMKMDEGEFAELRAAVEQVAVQDVQLGYVLNLLVLHLGHLYGFDPAQEDAKIKQAQEDAEQAATDASATPVDASAPSDTPATVDSTPIEATTPPTDVPPITQEGVSA